MRLIETLLEHPLLDTELPIDDVYKPLGFELHTECHEPPIDPEDIDQEAFETYARSPDGYIASLPFEVPAGFTEVDRYENEDAIVLLALKPLTPLAELLLGQEETAHALAAMSRERRRQVEAEGWSVERDGLYPLGVLASAGQAYLTAYRFQQLDVPMVRPSAWPWDATWWKPSEQPARNLEKAGALTLAELERLSRTTHKGGAA